LRLGTASVASGGLGLRISQRLIQLLGGSLEVTSTSSGSTLAFSLALPPGASAGAGQALESWPDLTGYSALIVEDVPSNQTVLAALLQRPGMTHSLADTAAQGQEKLQSSHYDFAFMDIQLPDANGANLAETMRKLQPDVRVIAVTAQVSPELRATCE